MQRLAILNAAMILLMAAAACADDERDATRGQKDERVHELMERIHEGRRSPYRRLRRIAEGEAAAWEAVARAVQELEPMRRALLESKDDEIKDSADGYVGAVEELAAAVRNRDAEAVRAGFRSLTQSCGDCHFDGGVGGELDDEFAVGRKR